MRFRGISYRQTLFLNPIALHFLNLETSATRLARDLLVLYIVVTCTIFRFSINMSSERFELELVLVLVVDVEDEEVEDVDVDLSCHSTRAELEGMRSLQPLATSERLQGTRGWWLPVSKCWEKNNQLNDIESIKSFSLSMLFHVFVSLPFAVSWWTHRHRHFSGSHEVLVLEELVLLLDVLLEVVLVEDVLVP